MTLTNKPEGKTKKPKKDRDSETRKQPKETPSGEKKEKLPKERKPQEPWKQSRKIFNDMAKVQSFAESLGGEKTIREMKKDFNNAMKRGTEVAQREQWEIFGKIVEDFSAHIASNKDQLTA